jgi:hypothetical protein
MPSWHEAIAKQMGSKHSDTVAVVRWGKLAKRATQRRLRRSGKAELQSSGRTEHVEAK